jgi:hypothetical protein
MTELQGRQTLTKFLYLLKYKPASLQLSTKNKRPNLVLQYSCDSIVNMQRTLPCFLGGEVIETLSSNRIYESNHMKTKSAEDQQKEVNL